MLCFYILYALGIPGDIYCNSEWEETPCPAGPRCPPGYDGLPGRARERGHPGKIQDTKEIQA